MREFLHGLFAGGLFIVVGAAFYLVLGGHLDGDEEEESTNQQKETEMSKVFDAAALTEEAWVNDLWPDRDSEEFENLTFADRVLVSTLVVLTPILAVLALPVIIGITVVQGRHDRRAAKARAVA